MRLIDADEYKKRISRYPTIKAIAFKELRYVKTIDAEPVRHGHWIMKPNGYGTCSNCQKCSLDIMGGVDSNYCPNCGAKMDEEEQK